MSETIVSKTVSMKLDQVQWLDDKYGNVSKGIQEIINDRMEDEQNGNDSSEE